MTLYIKTPATQPPKKVGHYYIDPPTAFFTEGKNFYNSNGEKIEVTEWLKPVEPEAIGLEDTAQKFGLCRCDEAYTKRGMTAPDCPWHGYAVEEAMEFYYQQNTAALREKIERMDREAENLQDHIEILADSDNALRAKMNRAQQQVKTLAEALRVISPERLDMLATYLDIVDERNEVTGQTEVQDDLRRMANLSRAALATLDQDQKGEQK